MIPSALNPILRSDNHLRHTLPAQRLAGGEALALESSQSVADGGNGQDDAGRDERGHLEHGRDKLDDGEDGVDGGAHVVGLEPADEGVELGRGRAYPQQQRYLDEEDHEGEDSVVFCVSFWECS